MSDPLLSPGCNVAVKCPAADHARLVAFYRDTVGLPIRHETADTTAFTFGAMVLWINRVPDVTRAEVWLELQTPDAAAAGEALKLAGIPRCDHVEPLPAGFRGFWIAAPGDFVHLVAEPGQS